MGKKRERRHAQRIAGKKPPPNPALLFATSAHIMAQTKPIGFLPMYKPRSMRSALRLCGYRWWRSGGSCFQGGLQGERERNRRIRQMERGMDCGQRNFPS